MWVLPILLWFLSALLLARRGWEWRNAFLAAAVFWGCLVTAFTEVLSYFDLLTTGGLALCWAVATAVVLLLNVRLKKPWQVWGNDSFSAVETGLAGGVALICLATFVTAILAPPNSWDSMTYHMGRVMHWLQNRSVDHYPTHILRQLDLNPWAEFAIAHFQALSGGDRFANLVQWFSMVGSLVGASLIAEQLGGDRRAQLFAAVVAATIPMGILQSTSTQNDYVVAFWLICLAWAGLEFMKEKESKWALMAGASIGLAVLTKGTAYLYAFPFAIWIGFAALRGAARQVSLAVVCMAIPFILMNSPHYQRNLRVFANPLTAGDYGLSNESISIGTLVSNLFRNAALQLKTPFDGINQFIGDGVAQLHETLNLDVNDPKTTWRDNKFRVGRLTRHEDLSGNFLHVTLAFAALLTLVFSRAKGKAGTATLCCVSAVVAGFLLFCLILKWQPWHGRLLLPQFVLGAPAIAVIAANCWRPRLVAVVALVLLTAALPWVFSNISRPLVHVSREAGVMFPLLTVDRNRIYFVNNRDLYERYMQIAADIRQKNATSIGLVLSEDGWEYPLWVLIKEGNPTLVCIEHVEVENASRFIRTADFRPDYIVKID